jgi:hypothetical protein
LNKSGKDKAMKVCSICGIEIDTRDGENQCASCIEASNKKKNRARQLRRERDQIMKDLGLTKVKGALGGVYWE